MLMMEITDGISQVKGMEYQSIPFLDINVKPGTKVSLFSYQFIHYTQAFKERTAFNNRDNVSLYKLR